MDAVRPPTQRNVPHPRINSVNARKDAGYEANLSRVVFTKLQFGRGRSTANFTELLFGRFSRSVAAVISSPSLQQSKDQASTLPKLD